MGIGLRLGQGVSFPIGHLKNIACYVITPKGLRLYIGGGVTTKLTGCNVAQRNCHLSAAPCYLRIREKFYYPLLNRWQTQFLQILIVRLCRLSRPLLNIF